MVLPALEMCYSVVTFVDKPHLKLISTQNYKHKTLIYTWSEKTLRVPL